MTRLVLLSVIAVLLWAGRAEAEPCVITAEQATIAGLQVQPANEDAFSLDIFKVPVEVRPGEKGESELLVKAPLRFAVEHGLTRFQARLAKRSVLLDGRLVLAKGMDLSFSGSDHDKRDAENSIASVLPFGEFHPRRLVAIPCEALDLWSEDRSNRVWKLPALQLPDKPIAHIRVAELTPLYARREAVDPFWFKFAGPLVVLEEKDSWLRVRARWNDGSILRGWIPKKLVNVERSAPFHGAGGLGTFGAGHCGRSHRPRLVKFKVHAHAPIHTGPRGAIWAHTAAAIQVEAFSLGRSDGWVQIGKLEGLPSQPCGEHNKIWVHASHLLWDEKAP